MDFIRPAARAHWFEDDDPLEWGLLPDERPDLLEDRPDLGDLSCPPQGWPETPSEEPNLWAITS